MTVITDRESGLFPHPAEIKMSCSCRDWAGLCKHLARAVFYGIGARLDHQPELLFALRQADHSELIAEAISAKAIPDAEAAELDSSSLSDVFGIDIDTTGEPDAPPPASKPTRLAGAKIKRLTKKQREQITKALKTANKRATGSRSNSRKRPQPQSLKARATLPRKKGAPKAGLSLWKARREAWQSVPPPQSLMRSMCGK